MESLLLENRTIVRKILFVPIGDKYSKGKTYKEVARRSGGAW